MLINRAGNLLLQTAEHRQALAVGRKIRRQLSIFCYEVLHRLKGLHRRQNVHQGLRLQHTAQLRTLDISNDIIRAAEGEASALIQQAQRLCCFLLQSLDLGKFIFNLQGSHCLLA